MSPRVTDGVERDEPFVVTVNGREVAAHAGESVAAVLIAAGLTALRRDARGRSRGAFCNMGTCHECIVRIEYAASSASPRPAWVRACMTPVQPGMRVHLGDIR